MNAFVAFAQTSVDVRPDSVKVVNGEFIIENATKNIQGYLYNIGNGVTRFQQLNFDNTPTDGSYNSVYSYGVKKYIDSTKWLLNSSNNFHVSTAIPGGGGNIVIGWLAGNGSNITGNFNIVMGKEAARSLTGGWNNVILGYKAGMQTATGSGNVYIGRNVGYENNDGNYNIGLGFGLAFSGSRKLNIGGVLFGKNMYNAALGNTFYEAVQDGQIGIGVTDPTATLHLAPGKVSAEFQIAPLKFTAGVNLTTPQDGAVEYDGANYYVTAGTVRYTLVKTLTATETINFPAVGMNTYGEATVTLQGASPGDIVNISCQNVPDNSMLFIVPSVKVANAVHLKLINYTGADIAAINNVVVKVSIVK